MACLVLPPKSVNRVYHTLNVQTKGERRRVKHMFYMHVHIHVYNSYSDTSLSGQRRTLLATLKFLFILCKVFTHKIYVEPLRAKESLRYHWLYLQSRCPPHLENISNDSTSHSLYSLPINKIKYF